MRLTPTLVDVTMGQSKPTPRNDVETETERTLEAQHTVILVIPRPFHLPLGILAPPVSLPAPSLRQIWHVRSADDPATTLLRRLVQNAAPPAERAS